MSGQADILLYVQHLLGIGHLRRAAAIARALGAAGMKVVVVSGGRPVAGLDLGRAKLVQLPPLQSRDERFTGLADEAGQAVDEAWKAARAARLLQIFEAAQPRILITEMFPLGRRQMRFELLPLLEAATNRTPRPAIVCSVRDILNEQRDAAKRRWMAETLELYYDRVLVHGDPAIVTLDRSFPAIADVRTEVVYTGYVVNEAPALQGDRHGSLDGGERQAPPEAAGEVLVSAGGGRVAAPLIEAALAARPLGPLGTAPWRVLVGAHFPQAAYKALCRTCPDGVAVERARPDFQSLLSGCRLSISQAGYNTVMEVLRSRRPAVVVPFAAGAETEQTQRANLLADKGLLAVVAEAGLSGARLDRGIRQALAQSPSRAPAADLEGAAKTAALLGRMLAQSAPRADR